MIWCYTSLDAPAPYEFELPTAGASRTDWITSAGNTMRMFVSFSFKHTAAKGEDNRPYAYKMVQNIEADDTEKLGSLDQGQSW